MRTPPLAKIGLVLVAIAALSGLARAGASSDLKVEAELVSDARSIVPGQPFPIALKQTIARNWHTYWKNPGDSGLPTTITWTLPEGFTASEISWPIPHAIPVGPLMNYGYEGEVLLPVTITPPSSIESQVVTLKASAQWLVCEDICIPESADLEIKLRVAPPGSQSLPSRDAAKFEQLRRAVPIPAPWKVTAVFSPDKLALRLNAQELQRDRISSIEFFPDTGGEIDHAAPQSVSWTKNGPTLATTRGDTDLNGPAHKTIDGLLVITERLDGKTVRNGFTVSAPLTAATPDDIPDNPTTTQAMGISLWQAVIFAALGGMILNLMPCVLPILSLKVMSLATHNGPDAPRSAKTSGLWYLAGVLVSFAVLAFIVIALKSAGAAMGWGFQFQSPLFVLVMAGIFFMLGLSLSGVFDIGVGLEGTGQSLATRPGTRGSFFTGALATIAATPCTAPFMGAAIGYALSRPAVELFIVLQALGLGFALPMLLLSVSGTAQKILPKPGPWMETLKQVLAFPLYATVGWLVWVLSVQSGSVGVLSAAIVLVALGFVAWFLGRTGVSTSTRAVISALVAIPAFVFVTPMLNATPAKLTTTVQESTAARYEPFSTKRLAELRAHGRPVLVNFTAAWCITCKLNEQLALSSNTFYAALKNRNVAYLKGDWTRQDQEITRILKSFGRSGVPLYVLYPAEAGASPVVLPQLLTQGIVLGHLNALPEPIADSAGVTSGQ